LKGPEPFKLLLCGAPQEATKRYKGVDKTRKIGQLEYTYFTRHEEMIQYY